MDLGVLLEYPQGSQSSSRVGACTCAFLPALAAVSRFPSHGSKDLWLSLEAFPRGFPRGFPTGLFHVPAWCESIIGLKVEAVQGKQVSLEFTEKSGASGNGGTTLEFLSPFLWRGPPLELRREHRVFFPDNAGKGSLLLREEVATELLCMWAGLSCFLSSGDGYVGELLELQEGCEIPFGSSRG